MQNTHFALVPLCAQTQVCLSQRCGSRVRDSEPSWALSRAPVADCPPRLAGSGWRSV